MSHTVTVTRTTTTTTTSALVVNTGYMKTWPGILKLLQLIIGIVNVGILSYYYLTYFHAAETFFLIIAVTFMIGTFLLLLSCLISISTASIISKTIYEVVYHTFAFLLYLIAGIYLLIVVSERRRSVAYEPYMAAGVLGLVVSALYLVSAYFARRSYRGI